MEPSWSATGRSPVALHVELTRVGGDGFPAALLGGIAFVRQSFIDAQYQQLVQQRYQKGLAGLARPSFDPALAAMLPALAGQLPVAFEAGLQREVLRALDMAKEFKLSAIVTSGDLFNEGTRVRHVFWTGGSSISRHRTHPRGAGATAAAGSDPSSARSRATWGLTPIERTLTSAQMTGGNFKERWGRRTQKFQWVQQLFHRPDSG